jgi:hypothetical protein
MYIVLATDTTGRRFFCGAFDVLADANAKVTQEATNKKWNVTESKNVSAFNPAVELPLNTTP